MHAADDDRGLAERARAGDAAARWALWQREAGPARALAVRLARLFAFDPALEFDDVYQEAYLAFVAVLADWDPAGEVAFGRFLNVRLRYVLRDRVRRLTDQHCRRRHPLEPESDPPVFDPPAPDDPGPAATLVGLPLAAGAEPLVLDRVLLAQLQADLAETDRRLLHLRFHQGLPLTRLASQFGTTPGTLRGRLLRLLRRLRRHLPREDA